MRMPSGDRERLVLGKEGKGAAGGLTSDVLAEAFAEATATTWPGESAIADPAMPGPTGSSEHA
jgi:hypothetical protein